MPPTPSRTFTQEALEGILTVTPSLALPEGNVGRLLANRLMTEDGFEEAWEDAMTAQRKAISGPGGRVGPSSGGALEEGDGAPALADESSEGRKK